MTLGFSTRRRMIVALAWLAAVVLLIPIADVSSSAAVVARVAAMWTIALAASWMFDAVEVKVERIDGQ